MKFSERMGYVRVRDKLQLEEMSPDLRNLVWNCIHTLFVWENAYIYPNKQAEEQLRLIRMQFLKQAISSDFYHPDEYKNFKKWFLEKATWYEIYDFIEFVINNHKALLKFTKSNYVNPRDVFIFGINSILQREMSGYRIINNCISQITDTNEIAAIEEAVAEVKGWDAVTQHVNSAANMAFDRRKPDYRNSVKESITAVESACKLITGLPNADLNAAIKELEKKHKLHPAYKDAFIKLFAYTSDADGIRHGGIDLEYVAFEDAKFFLVTCSAFINYLKGSLSS
jgi:hypothetical protein